MTNNAEDMATDALEAETEADTVPVAHAISQPHSYRPDIDGLRAIAVTAVVIFHAYPSVLPSGFIGVDMFFVISGFLISGIILKELKRKNFSFVNFYSRRIRRIFPALIVVLLFVIILACLFLEPRSLRHFADTLLASTLFGANIQLLTYEPGYFDEGKEKNALLHLWSLGVEEQFYIVWPLLAMVLYKMPRVWSYVLLFSIMIISFGLSIALSSHHSSQGFYLPFTRFWQLATGSALAMLSPARGQSKRVELPITGLGFSLTLIGLVVIREFRPYPSWWAIFPTLGCALLIAGGHQSPLNRFVIGVKPLPEIGLISYPLYLWHWPLLVFAQVLFPDERHKPWWAQPWMMVLTAVVLSVATYSLEKRVRFRKSRMVVPVLVGIVVVIGAISIAIGKHPNEFSRLYVPESSGPAPSPPPVQSGRLNSSRGPMLAPLTLAQVNAAIDDWQFPPLEGQTDLMPFAPESSVYRSVHPRVLNTDDRNRPVLAVLGDSHGLMASHRFVKLYKSARESQAPFPVVYYMAQNGVPFLPCVMTPPSLKTRFDEILQALKQVPPQVVLIVNNFNQWVRPSTQSPQRSPELRCCYGGGDSCSYQTTADADEILLRFTNGVKDLVDLGVKVYVVTVSPQGLGFDPRLMKNAFGIVESNTRPILLSDFQAENQWILDKVKGAVDAAGATLIDFADNMCWENLCEVFDRYGRPIMKDDDHLRPFHAADYLDTIDDVVNAALGTH